MLAQNFKTADDLKISEAQKDALAKTLVLFETGKIAHAKVGNGYFPEQGEYTGHFNMNQWNSLIHGCGTVACIGGTAELIGGVNFDRQAGGFDSPLYRLFMPNLPEWMWDEITPAHAAIALRSYLTTGEARWDLALAA